MMIKNPDGRPSAKDILYDRGLHEELRDKLKNDWSDSYLRTYLDSKAN